MSFLRGRNQDGSDHLQALWKGFAGSSGQGQKYNQDIRGSYPLVEFCSHVPLLLLAGGDWQLSTVHNGKFGNGERAIEYGGDPFESG